MTLPISLGAPRLGARYRREVERRLASMAVQPSMVVTERDLRVLPEPVARLLRGAEVVGRPRVHHVRARWRGRIRADAGTPWMPFRAEQWNFPGEPARFFCMKARSAGLPVQVLHELHHGSARMEARLISLIPVMRASGPEMDRAEAVTLLNDLCLLAPCRLLDDTVGWEPIDTASARAHYTWAGHAVSAVVHVDEEGRLVDFVSDDRRRAVDRGRRFVAQRWSTPVHDYRAYGPLRAPSRGEGIWHAPEGPVTYMEVELLGLDADGTAL